MKKLLLFLLLLSSVNFLFSQDILYIHGKIVGNKDSLGIKDVSLLVEHHHLGTITNNDGVFRFTIDRKYENDTIIISHLSYKRIKVAIADISKDISNTFYLEEKINNLTEVVIGSDSTYLLLNRAFLNTEKAIIIPVILQTYYKETVLKNGNYIVFADALLDVYIGNIIQHRINESRVIKENNITINSNPIQLQSLTNVYGAISKNKKNAIKTHTYRLEEDNNNKYYIVRVIPNKTSTEISNLFSANIYIDKNTMLIMRVEANVSPECIKLIKKQNRDNFQIEFTNIEQVFNYKIIANKLYLDYSMLKVELSKHYDSHTDDYTYNDEMQLLNIPVTKHKKFKKRTVFNANYIYKSKGNYSYEFWNKANIKRPTEKEQEFINKH